MRVSAPPAARAEARRRGKSPTPQGWRFGGELGLRMPRRSGTGRPSPPGGGGAAGGGLPRRGGGGGGPPLHPEGGPQLVPAQGLLLQEADRQLLEALPPRVENLLGAVIGGGDDL